MIVQAGRIGKRCAASGGAGRPGIRPTVDYLPSVGHMLKHGLRFPQRWSKLGRILPSHRFLAFTLPRCAGVQDDVNDIEVVGVR